MSAAPNEKAKPARAKKRSDDVVLVHSPTNDGKGYNVLRKRGDELSAGAIRSLEPGKPVHGEIVRLRPREESPALFDVDVQVDATQQTGTGRPAKVATDQYRDGWDTIWAKPKPAADRTLN